MFKQKQTFILQTTNLKVNLQINTQDLLSAEKNYKVE